MPVCLIIYVYIDRYPKRIWSHTQYFNMHGYELLSKQNVVFYPTILESCITCIQKNNVIDVKIYMQIALTKS